MTREFPKDLGGFQFGEWYVVPNTRETDSGSKYATFLCRCSCGTERRVQRSSLLQGKSKSCRGHFKGPVRSKSPKWRGEGEISGEFYGKIKHNAKTRKIEFSVSLSYLWNLFLKQDRKCALSGQTLEFPSQAFVGDGTASLDRKDSSMGYIEGNVQWVHKYVNLAKRSLSDEEFINLCRKVAVFNATY